MSNTDHHTAGAQSPGATAYVGRFAPSPTGELHFGSLIGALASYLDARAHHGQWLMRVEDIDPPREIAGAAEAILGMLRHHGLHWDGEVFWQHNRQQAYEQALAQLQSQGKAYFCTCSRRQLAGHRRYPGTCRGTAVRPDAPAAVRIDTRLARCHWHDGIQGECRYDIEADCGDFIVQRKDGLIAYQLAVVLDDAAQGITHVVRGSDLLHCTPWQIHLQQLLGLPTPHYSHFPVAADSAGVKLSKQTRAPALSADQAPGNLRHALAFLRQSPPPPALAQPTAILDWAVEHWSPARIPAVEQISDGQINE